MSNSYYIPKPTRAYIEPAKAENGDEILQLCNLSKHQYKFITVGLQLLLNSLKKESEELKQITIAEVTNREAVLLASERIKHIAHEYSAIETLNNQIYFHE